MNAKDYENAHLAAEVVWWRGAHIAEAMACVTVVALELFALLL
jgi:hypothetical protein